MNDVDSTSAANTLEQWRSAERVVAVARRGKKAAAAAVEAAREAMAAAQATADAANTALAAAMLAEKSAARTAAAARIVLQGTQADFADASGDVDAADVGEAEAREHYRDAIGNADR